MPVDMGRSCLDTSGALDIESESDTLATLAAEFCMDSDGEDATEPQFDEFDLWQRQQQMATSENKAAKENISTFQKLFLEELNQDGDVNGAAARALQRLAAPIPSSSPAPRASQLLHFMEMADDEDGGQMDQELDEFDLWEQQQVSASASRPEEQRQAISSLQKLFLDELGTEGDVNGAAAKALRRFMPPPRPSSGAVNEAEAPQEQAAPDDHAPVTTQKGDASPRSDAKRHRASAAFRARFVEEFKRSGDANDAVAQILQRLSASNARESPTSPLGQHQHQAGGIERQRFLSTCKAILAKEASEGHDVNGAVAAALLRLRTAKKMDTRVEKPQSQLARTCRQEALDTLKGVLATEADNHDDPTGAVAAALLRLRNAREVN